MALITALIPKEATKGQVQYLRIVVFLSWISYFIYNLIQKGLGLGWQYYNPIFQEAFNGQGGMAYYI